MHAITQHIAVLKDLVAASPVPVVFDHFGGARAELGPQQPGFLELVDLVQSGKAYVKISGAYRVSKLAPDYADVVPLAKALIAADCREPGAHCLGHGLAASRIGHPARAEADGRESAAPNR